MNFIVIHLFIRNFVPHIFKVANANGSGLTLTLKQSSAKSYQSIFSCLQIFASFFFRCSLAPDLTFSRIHALNYCTSVYFHVDVLRKQNEHYKKTESEILLWNWIPNKTSLVGNATYCIADSGQSGHIKSTISDSYETAPQSFTVWKWHSAIRGCLVSLNEKVN